jgi:CBS domain-containing protein
MQEQLLEQLAGARARDLMSEPAVTIPSGLSLHEAQSYFARYRYAAFPVVDGSGRAVGLLSIGRLEHVPPRGRADTPVDDLLERDPRLLVGEDEEVTHLLEQPPFQRLGRAVVVDDAGRPLGLLSLTDIQRALRASQLGGSVSSSDGSWRITPSTSRRLAIQAAAGPAPASGNCGPPRVEAADERGSRKRDASPVYTWSSDSLDPSQRMRIRRRCRRSSRDGRSTAKPGDAAHQVRRAGQDRPKC